ncbi:MAG: GAF domain-containing protein, partial [Frankiaceae bacterium]|nr:GAF domain-containing protein [Frankiaceae bacterium]
ISRSLLRLAREVTARHDLDDVLAEAFRETRKTVEFSGGSIQLIDDEGWITVAASDPPLPAETPTSRVPLGNSVAGRVVLTEQAVYIADVEADGREIRLPTLEWAASVRSYLAVPLLVDGRAIGLLRIDDVRVDAFTPTDRQFLTAAGVVIAAAIQNARAHARSTSARSRAEALEFRIDQLRTKLSDAKAATPADTAEISVLLDALEAMLGEPKPAIQMPDEPRVTL